MDNLEEAASVFSKTIKEVITTSQYNLRSYDNGSRAKEALIRSQTLIQLFHEALKVSIKDALHKEPYLSTLDWSIYPEIGSSSPEKKIFGHIKGKDQDVVFTHKPHCEESLVNLPSKDKVGFLASNSSIVCGVRSQMSSVDKNFDTLMERAIAEAVNLRIRLPNVTLVELYVIPVNEIDEVKARDNIFEVKRNCVNLEKFIRQFYLTTVKENSDEVYMMHATCLLIIDLDNDGKIIRDEFELMKRGFSKDVCEMFSLLKPEGLTDRVIKSYISNIEK